MSGETLDPPGGRSRAGVGFCPGVEPDGVVAHLDTGEFEGPIRWATHHRTVGAVAGTVAGALKLLI